MKIMPAFQPYFLMRLLLLVPSFTLMIIGAFLLTSDTQIFAELVANETADWGMPPITDFIAVHQNFTMNFNSTFDNSGGGDDNSKLLHNDTQDMDTNSDLNKTEQNGTESGAMNSSSSDLD